MPTLSAMAKMLDQIARQQNPDNDQQNIPKNSFYGSSIVDYHGSIQPQLYAPATGLDPRELQKLMDSMEMPKMPKTLSCEIIASDLPDS